MANENGIGYSPLTEKVYMGRQNTKQRTWVGEKKDITNQFIAVMFEYLEPNSVRTIDSCSNGMSNMFFNITKDKKSIRKMITYLERVSTEL
jgi:hypothetical protein